MTSNLLVKSLEIKTEFLTSKCAEQGYPILFSEVPDMVRIVKVLEESNAGK